MIEILLQFLLGFGHFSLNENGEGKGSAEVKSGVVFKEGMEKKASSSTASQSPLAHGHRAGFFPHSFQETLTSRATLRATKEILPPYFRVTGHFKPPVIVLSLIVNQPLSFKSRV